jgi:hypothetical protein
MQVGSPSETLDTHSWRDTLGINPVPPSSGLQGTHLLLHSVILLTTMFAHSFVPAVLFGASIVVAASSHHPVTSCKLANATPTFPPGQTALAQPTGAPSFITLGAGIQNYTCNATSGTYV